MSDKKIKIIKSFHRGEFGYHDVVSNKHAFDSDRLPLNIPMCELYRIAHDDAKSSRDRVDEIMEMDGMETEQRILLTFLKADCYEHLHGRLSTDKKVAEIRKILKG